MRKPFLMSNLFIVLIVCNIMASDHQYRIILQGIDYPSAGIEIIMNKIMFRPMTEISIDKDYYDINYDVGIGYLSLDNKNYSLVPSLSYIGNNSYDKYVNNNNKEIINRYYSMGLGINIAFYWYWNHLLLGGYLPLEQ